MATQISQFRNRIVSEVPGCPFPRIDTAVIDALRMFCEDSYLYTKSFEEEDIAYGTIDTSDNDSLTITLSTYYSDADPICPLFFQIDGADWDLKELVLENDNSNLTQIEEDGVKFFSFPTTTSMKIFPFTDQSVNFDVFLKLAVKPSEDVTSVEDKFWNEKDWRDAVIAQAAGMLQSMPGRGWTDYGKAGVNFAIYRSNLASARIKAEHGNTKGSIAVEGGYF